MLSDHRIRFLLLCLSFHLSSSMLFSQATPIVSEGFPIPLETGRFLTPREGPVLCDLNGDDQIEIVVASGKKVYAIQNDGSFLSGWPQATAYEIRDSPVIGDLDRDGRFEIIAVALNALTDQSLLYTWNNQGVLLPGFPLAILGGYNPVSLYDLDGDGNLEIIGGFETKVFVFRHDGTIAPGWPQDIAPFYPIAKISLGDIDADGEPEIVVPGQYAADRFEDYLGQLYVWNVNGELKPGWPTTLADNYTFAASNDAILVDVDLDGFLEIAVGTFKFIPPNVSGFAVLYRYDGTIAQGWPQFTAGADSLNGFQSGPAAADIDRDGFPDLIFGDGYDHLAVWKGDGTSAAGWPIILSQVDSTLVGRSTLSNPSVGDIDGDGELEILTTSNAASLKNGIWLGRILAFNHNGTTLSWPSLKPQQSAGSNSVALGDLDHDGSVELIAVSNGRPVLSQPQETWLTVWEVPGVPYVEERFPWPMFGHDRWHTSQYGFKPPDEPTVAVKERREGEHLPRIFALEQNYPNPFYGAGASRRSLSNRTEISYQLPVNSHVTLRMFNLLGEEVCRLVEATRTSGMHKVFWDGRNDRGEPLPAGIYFYRMEAQPQSRGGEKFSAIKKLTKLN